MGFCKLLVLLPLLTNGGSPEPLEISSKSEVEGSSDLTERAVSTLQPDNAFTTLESNGTSSSFGPSTYYGSGYSLPGSQYHPYGYSGSLYNSGYQNHYLQPGYTGNYDYLHGYTSGNQGFYKYPNSYSGDYGANYGNSYSGYYGSTPKPQTAVSAPIIASQNLYYPSKEYQYPTYQYYGGAYKSVGSFPSKVDTGYSGYTSHNALPSQYTSTTPAYSKIAYDKSEEDDGSYKPEKYGGAIKYPSNIQTTYPKYNSHLPYTSANYNTKYNYDISPYSYGHGHPSYNYNKYNAAYPTYVEGNYGKGIYDFSKYDGKYGNQYEYPYHGYGYGYGYNSGKNGYPYQAFGYGPSYSHEYNYPGLTAGNNNYAKSVTYNPHTYSKITSSPSTIGVHGSKSSPSAASSLSQTGSSIPISSSPVKVVSLNDSTVKKISSSYVPVPAIRPTTHPASYHGTYQSGLYDDGSYKPNLYSKPSVNYSGYYNKYSPGYVYNSISPGYVYGSSSAGTLSSSIAPSSHLSASKSSSSVSSSLPLVASTFTTPAPKLLASTISPLPIVNAVEKTYPASYAAYSYPFYQSQYTPVHPGYAGYTSSSAFPYPSPAVSKSPSLSSSFPSVSTATTRLPIPTSTVKPFPAVNAVVKTYPGSYSQYSYPFHKSQYTPAYSGYVGNFPGYNTYGQVIAANPQSPVLTSPKVSSSSSSIVAPGILSSYKPSSLSTSAIKSSSSFKPVKTYPGTTTTSYPTFSATPLVNNVYYSQPYSAYGYNTYQGNAISGYPGFSPAHTVYHSSNLIPNAPPGTPSSSSATVSSSSTSSSPSLPSSLSKSPSLPSSASASVATSSASVASHSSGTPVSAFAAYSSVKPIPASYSTALNTGKYIPQVYSTHASSSNSQGNIKPYSYSYPGYTYDGIYDLGKYYGSYDTSYHKLHPSYAGYHDRPSSYHNAYPYGFNYGSDYAGYYGSYPAYKYGVHPGTVFGNTGYITNSTSPYHKNFYPGYQYSSVPSSSYPGYSETNLEAATATESSGKNADITTEPTDLVTQSHK